MASSARGTGEKALANVVPDVRSWRTTEVPSPLGDFPNSSQSELRSTDALAAPDALEHVGGLIRAVRRMRIATCWPMISSVE